MQSTKNRRLRSLDKNIEVKERTRVFRFPKISFSWFRQKAEIVPVDEVEKLHAEQMNLAQFNRDQNLLRAKVEASYFRK